MTATRGDSSPFPSALTPPASKLRGETWRGYCFGFILTCNIEGLVPVGLFVVVFGNVVQNLAVDGEGLEPNRHMQWMLELSMCQKLIGHMRDLRTFRFVVFL